jgi:DNA-binding FrmR family transcriptional regulator
MGAVISEQDWYDVGGGESGWIAPHPKDSNITFAGSYDGFLTRYDRRTGQTRDITIWPDNPIGYGAESLKYRFQWNFPLIYSQHSDTLYAAANVLFKSTDEGGSWEEISPDLTRNDKARQKSSGGPITKDNTSVEYYCTIFALAESPLQPGLLWAGSDDGLVHITRDGGKSWQKITPPNMPEWIQINAIDASPHDPATAYVAATMYKMDDFRPYLYKTTDYGKTWQTIVNGLPNNSFTRVVREDPNRRGLLYAGTETGIYVSFNDGQSWQSLQLNLPAVPITDLAIHKRDKDLVIATQGRSFWILDNLNVIHQYNDIVNSKDFHLFAPEEAYRLAGFGFSLSTQATVGENLANGLILHFYLKESLGPDAKITLEFFDQNNKLVKSFTGVPKTDTPRTQPDDSQKPTFAVEPGLNRFVWNFRTFDATSFPGIILWAGSTQGPRVPPGQYEVRLTVNGQTLSQSCAVRKDPRINTTSEDFAKQYELGLKMRDKVTDMHKAILRIREIRGQLESLNPRLSADAPETKDVVTQIGDLKKKITAIEEELYQTKLRSSQDPLNFPIKLNNKMTALAEVIDGEYAPTRQAFLVYQDLLGRIDQQLQQLQEVLKNDLPKLNQLARDKNLPLVMLMPEKEAAK